MNELRTQLAPRKWQFADVFFPWPGKSNRMWRVIQVALKFLF